MEHRTWLIRVTSLPGSSLTSFWSTADQRELFLNFCPNQINGLLTGASTLLRFSRNRFLSQLNLDCISRQRRRGGSGEEGGASAEEGEEGGVPLSKFLSQIWNFSKFLLHYAIKYNSGDEIEPSSLEVSVQAGVTLDRITIAIALRPTTALAAFSYNPVYQSHLG